MAAVINTSRLPCPELRARGMCSTPGCAYSHTVRVDNSVYTEPPPANKAPIGNLTGTSGQFVGSRKGGNAVPVKQSGDIPAFLRHKIGSPSASSTPPSEQMRTGGNDVPVRPTTMLANVPIQRVKEAHHAPVDWKAIALSRVATKPGIISKKEQLESEIAKLSAIENEKQRTLAEIDKELAYLHQRREEALRRGGGVDIQAVQSASIDMRNLIDRCGALAAAVEEERARATQALDLMESTNLVDLGEIRLAQAQILDEITAGFEKFRKLSEFNFTEFKVTVHKARNSRS